MSGKELRILRVDLADRISSSQEIESEYIELFLGGRGINRWILLHEIVSGTKACNWENKIVIGSGPITGTAAPGACRVQVDTIISLQ